MVGHGDGISGNKDSGGLRCVRVAKRVSPSFTPPQYPLPCCPDLELFLLPSAEAPAFTSYEIQIHLLQDSQTSHWLLA